MRAYFEYVCVIGWCLEFCYLFVVLMSFVRLQILCFLYPFCVLDVGFVSYLLLVVKDSSFFCTVICKVYRGC